MREGTGVLTDYIVTRSIHRGKNNGPGVFGYQAV